MNSAMSVALKRKKGFSIVFKQQIESMVNTKLLRLSELGSYLKSMEKNFHICISLISYYFLSVSIFRVIRVYRLYVKG